MDYEVKKLMFVSPMLLNKIDTPFEDENYLTELKLDGIRLILSKFNHSIKLYTRHKNEVTSKFPELLTIDIPDGTVLDGELIVPGENGKPDFEAMMERFQSTRSVHAIQFCVFDIIYYKGEKVTPLPLVERKKLIADVLPKDNHHIVEVQWLLGNATQYFELIKQNSLEGIVLKKSDSKYDIDKRSQNWLKLINYSYENVLITGMRKGEFGLHLSFMDGRYAGMMEFIPKEDRKLIYQHAKKITIEETEKQIIFKEPMECRVKYRNLTKNGRLRIPSFNQWVS